MDGTEIREQSGGGSATAEANTAAEAELADGLSLMEQFLSDPEHDYKTLKYGDVMEGIIMHLDRDELLVDIGSKAEGIVPAKEYSSLSAEEKDKLEIGDTVLVFVVQPENPEGHPVVSIDRARQEKSWRKLQEMHEQNQVIEAEVTNYNKGGLLVNLDGVRGFVPASQVSEIRGGDESSKQADMARLIGSTLPLKVIEINRHRNRLILSERQAIQERRDVMKERLIEELNEGEIRDGRVSSICDFGAFVDIGGADGLVHLSELSWSRVRHPSELLKIGEEVKVYVLSINAQDKKIALSIKRTQAEPWSRVANSYEVGRLVRGTVTQLANFGAFARIEDGIEGLIHVSELADERIQHPKQVVGEGQDLLLRIIRIDPQRRRMGLSLRRALDTPDEELVTVFGEGILEERDALAQTIRAALDAEGLTGQIQEPRSSDGADDATGADAGGTDRGAGQVETRVVDQVAAFEERRQRAEEAASRASRQPAGRPQPRVSEERTAFEGEEMSAMEMAFALAGAPEDLLAEDNTPSRGGRKQRERSQPVTTEPAPVAEPVAAESQAEPEVRAEAEAAVAEATAEPVADESQAEADVQPEAEQVVAEATAEAATERQTSDPEQTASDQAPQSQSESAESTQAPDAPSAARNSRLPTEGEGSDWVAGDGTGTVPEGFPLKGNASSKIYHPTGSPSYEHTIAEIYFATDDAAQSAGYRLPKNMHVTADATPDQPAGDESAETGGEASDS